MILVVYRDLIFFNSIVFNNSGLFSNDLIGRWNKDSLIYQIPRTTSDYIIKRDKDYALLVKKLSSRAKRINSIKEIAGPIEQLGRPIINKKRVKFLGPFSQPLEQNY